MDVFISLYFNIGRNMSLHQNSMVVVFLKFSSSSLPRFFLS